MAVFAPTYARAFLSVAASAGLDVSSAQEQMGSFASLLMESHDLREVLMNPSIPSEQKLRVLDVLAERLGMQREVRNFVAVMMEHGRLASMHEILDEVGEIADGNSGLADAEITSAHALDEGERAAMERQVATLAGRKVRATYAEDASLLGGAIVKIGSTVYDGSIRAQLQEMKRRLMTS